MRLSTIIKQTAKRCDGYSVDVNSAYSTVSITDDNDPDNCVFMQGDDADRFIAECDALEKQTRSKTLTRYDIELCIASPYIENCL